MNSTPLVSQRFRLPIKKIPLLTRQSPFLFASLQMARATLSIHTVLSNLFCNPRLLESPGRAAVAIIIRDTSSSALDTFADRSHLGCLQVLFIQRAPNKHDPWSAHIAFPGGWRDNGDETDFDTACREALEELGLRLKDANTFKLLGRLNDRRFKHLRTEQHAVLSAFVFYLLPGSAPPPVSLQTEEVASAFWVPLTHLHAASPRVCTHFVSRFPRAHPPARLHLLPRLSQTARTFLGLNNLNMPAIDVLPVAEDFTRASNVTPPPVFLWGLTLGCVGDVVTALGFRRVDWPPAIPSMPVVAFFVRFFAELYWIISDLFSRIFRHLRGTRPIACHS